jgi:hypothetical protein
MRKDIFISYSHSEKDKIFFEEVKIQLAGLPRIIKSKTGLDIHVWDDTQIESGMDWKEEITKALKAARIGVLLVSSDFLASRFINDEEVPNLLKTVKKEGGTIIPLITRSCLFSDDERLNKFQAGHSPSHPLKRMDEDDREEVYVKMIQDIIKNYQKAFPSAQ